MDADELKRAFGRKVQALREAKGITQEALAELIKRSPDTVGNIERGVNSTRLETMAALASVFEVEVAELFAIEQDSADRRRRREVAALAKSLADLQDRDFCLVAEVVAATVKLAKRER